ncbi:hypothetical protein BB560_000974 [Smittium megazygosporum]|uniref:Uncharacterized protein n=1 Tax=Smittium megazygosporum TaxID=133381 RepID=A0A2T9ZIW5_9FUNG|nr:hypothetical protein BB560_000974 [Smittium megazygosporum]
MQNVALFVGRKGVGKGELVSKTFDVDVHRTQYNISQCSHLSLSLDYEPVSWYHKTLYYDFVAKLWIHNSDEDDALLDPFNVQADNFKGIVDCLVFVFDPFDFKSSMEFDQWCDFATKNEVPLKLCVANPTKPSAAGAPDYRVKLMHFDQVCQSAGWELVDMTKMYEPASLVYPSRQLVIKREEIDPEVGLNNYLHIILAFEQNFWSYMYSVYRPKTFGQHFLNPGIHVTNERLGTWIRNDAIEKMQFNILGISSKNLAACLYATGKVDYSEYEQDWDNLVSQFDDGEIMDLYLELFPEGDSYTVVNSPMESIDNVVYQLRRIHNQLSHLPDVERRIQAAKFAVAYSFNQD